MSICGGKGYVSSKQRRALLDSLDIDSCGKNCAKRRNCLEQTTSPFLTTFSNLYGTYGIYFPF